MSSSLNFLSTILSNICFKVITPTHFLALFTTIAKFIFLDFNKSIVSNKLVFKFIYKGGIMTADSLNDLGLVTSNYIKFLDLTNPIT